MNPKLHNALNINFDTWINPFVPHNQIRHLPKPVAYWFGYRTTPSKEPPTLIQWILTLIATVAGICVVGAVYTHAPLLKDWHSPSIVASLGASAVLDYNTVKSPLAQPRNVIVGHTLAAVVGVGVSKAFQYAPQFFVNYDWVVAAVACACASVAMSITNAVHPPGGATAILACTEAQVIALGWRFPAIMLIASALMLGVALLFNNTLRQYPTFWWTPEDVGSKLPRRMKEADAEAAPEKRGGEHKEHGSEASESGSTLKEEISNHLEIVEGAEEIVVLPYKLKVPAHLQLSDEDLRALQQLQRRIQREAEVDWDVLKDTH